MSDFAYSQEAENILNIFYQVDYMVYVEGEDDICFWEIVLNNTSNLKFEIQDVGGCDELQPYIERIKRNETNIIVACDSDLRYFSGDNGEHSNIIKTYGYSIENTFVTEKTLLRAIKTLGKISARDIPGINCAAWLEDFNHKIKKLICLDIHNFQSDRGISVVGDNSDRFMKSKNSSELCQNKIDDFINSLPQDFRDVNTENICNLIHPEMSSINYWVRGHFLFSASLRYVIIYLRSIGKKVSVSNDSFYSNLMNSFESIFNDSHEQYDHYKRQVDIIH